MPHHWGNFYVVTKDELVPKYYSEDNLRQTIWRYAKKPYGIKQVQKGGNGRQMLIDFDTLPKEMQDSIGDGRKMHHPLIKHYDTDALASRFYSQFEFEDGTPLKMDSIERYTTNASVLLAVQKLKEERLSDWSVKGKKQGKIMESLWRDTVTFNEYLPKLFGVTHSLPKGEIHFGRVFKTFLNGSENGLNYKSLISGKERNQNARIMTEEMITLLNDMFAGQEYKPTRTQVADQYQAFLDGELQIISHKTGEIYNPKETYFKPISDSSIISWLSKWENRIGTFAKRSGNRQEFMGQFIPYHSLEKVKEAGMLISIDDRQPPFFYAEGKRMWAYMAIDLGSEAWTTWVFGESKKELIVEFYRQMVRNYTEWGFNLPLGLECESSLNSSFKDTFLKNGVMFDNVRIEANNARGKHIERYFGKLRYEYEKDKEGWLGRPHARKEDNQRGAGKEIILEQKEIINNCLHDIQRWQNSEHSQYKGKSRWQVFTEMQTEQTQPTNWRGILPHLGFTTETSCRAGIIKFRNQEYLLGLSGQIALGEDLIRLMKNVEGKEFTVYWLDGNDNSTLKAMIYYNDMMLCDILPKPTSARAVHEQTEEGRLNRQIMSHYIATVNAFMSERKREIDQITIIDNRRKTLNNLFVIPGLENYKPIDTEPEVVDVPEEEFAFVPNQTQTARNWNQNF